MYNQALALHREFGDLTWEAITRNNIAFVYLSLGERRRAVTALEQALALARKGGLRRGEAVTLQNLGRAWAGEDRQKALACYRQALTIWHQLGDPQSRATTLNSMGLLRHDEGDDAQALEYYGQALALARSSNNPKLFGPMLNNLGTAQAGRGDREKGRESHLEALAAGKSAGDWKTQAQALLGIARSEYRLGRLTEARGRIEEGVKLVESVRTKIPGPELRASYSAWSRSHYEVLIDVLMALHAKSPLQGFDALAFQASEQARARSLLDLLAEARAQIRQGVEPELLAQEQNIEREMREQALQRTNATSNKHRDQPGSGSTAAKELDRLISEYQQVQEQIRIRSPRYAALTQPAPLSLAEVQKSLLDENTLLLAYWLGDQKSYLWAVAKTTLTSFELPKRAELEAVSLRLSNSLTARYQRGGSDALAQLSALVLSPVRAQLKNRLVVIADGALHHVPFAALLDPNDPSRDPKPLIAEHEVVNLPSASTLAVLRRETRERREAPKAIAVLADPVFDPADDGVHSKNNRLEVQPEYLMAHAGSAARIISSNGILPRLLFSRREATNILGTVPTGAAIAALDFKANREMALSAELRQYRILHFATHGLLNTEHPELSGLVFSLVDEQGRWQDGFVRLHDIYNLSLPAELVVLSACQTALGKEVKGEGLVGLTRGFMYAGALRVIATLWAVDDLATAELMRHFYQGLFKQGLTPAAALRVAQVAMWRQERWRSPYYWAPFQLQGEWN